MEQQSAIFVLQDGALLRQASCTNRASVCCSAKEAEAAVAKSQRALDGATKRFNDFERADAKRTEESKAAKAKAKKLRTRRDKDAAALQVCSRAA